MIVCFFRPSCPRSEDGGAEENLPDREQQQRCRRRRRRRQRQEQAINERAGHLRGGLEEIVAAMPIKAMKRRLEELGANPSRLAAACLEKVCAGRQG